MVAAEAAIPDSALEEPPTELERSLVELERSLVELRASRDRSRSAHLVALKRVCAGSEGLERGVEAVFARLSYLEEAGEEANLRLIQIVLEAKSGGKTATRTRAARLASLMRSMNMNMKLVETVGLAMKEWAAAMQETRAVLKPDRKLTRLLTELLKRSDALAGVNAGWKAVDKHIKALSRQHGIEGKKRAKRRPAGVQ